MSGEPFFCRFKQSFRIIQRGVGHGPPTSEKRRKWRKQEAVFDGFRAKKLFLGGLEKKNKCLRKSLEHSAIYKGSREIKSAPGEDARIFHGGVYET